MLGSLGHSEIGTNVANPSDKDDIIGDSEQIQLTNMQAFGGKAEELHWPAYFSVGFARNSQ